MAVSTDMPMPGQGSQFLTTQWTVVLSSSEDDAKRALEQLCQTYWRPIFAFVIKRGYPYADAQDLTQDFFVRILEGDLLKRADPKRGRFRSLLLKSLQNFLA